MTRKLTIAVVAVIVVAAAALGIVVLGSDDGSDQGVAATDAAGDRVTVSMAEWWIEADATEAPAGKVTFTVSNKGDIEHEFLVLRTDLAADRLPTTKDGEVDLERAGELAIGEEHSNADDDHTDAPAAPVAETRLVDAGHEGAGGDMSGDEDMPALGEESHMGPGETRTFSARLEPGRYLLLCNLPGHFQAGQQLELTVE